MVRTIRLRLLGCVAVLVAYGCSAHTGWTGMHKTFQKHEIAGLVDRPAWWQVRCEEITAAAKSARKGKTTRIATTAGGRQVWAVSYGPPAA